MNDTAEELQERVEELEVEVYEADREIARLEVDLGYQREQFEDKLREADAFYEDMRDERDQLQQAYDDLLERLADVDRGIYTLPEVLAAA